jgi:hypothetical protein
VDINERMFRVLQRSYGNPYKEGSRSWIAWAKGYDAARWKEVASLLKEGKKLIRKMRRSDRTVHKEK